MPFKEVSAATGEGLSEAMAMIVATVLRNIDGKRPSSLLQRHKKISFNTDADAAATFEEWKQTRESSTCCTTS